MAWCGIFQSLVCFQSKSICDTNNKLNFTAINFQIRDLNFSSGSSQIRVGGGLIACFREGPGVRFTKPNVTVNSVAVQWGSCLLPEKCEGKISFLDEG